MQVKSSTGYNKEHIMVRRWRQEPAQTFRTNKVFGSPIEMRKVLVAYACGLIDSYDHFYLYDRAYENRKMCRGCITTWLPGEIPPVDIDLDENGRYRLDVKWDYRHSRTWREERKKYRDYIKIHGRYVPDEQLRLFDINADGNVIQRWKYDRARNYNI